MSDVWSKAKFTNQIIHANIHRLIWQMALWVWDYCWSQTTENIQSFECMKENRIVTIWIFKNGSDGQIYWDEKTIIYKEDRGNIDEKKEKKDRITKTWLTFIYFVNLAMQTQTLEKIKSFIVDHIDWKINDSVIHVSSDDYIVKVQIIKKHKGTEWLDEWVQKCDHCHQKVSLRKVIFTSVFLSAIDKAYRRAKKNATWSVQISEIWLTPIEYSRFNDLVRFWLAYKDKSDKRWIYRLPMQRICQFMNGEWNVASYFLTDPTKTNDDPMKRIMSDERIPVTKVPNSYEILTRTNETMSEYYQNPDALSDNQNISWQVLDE